MAKFYKIVFGFNEDSYLSITSDELHKAQVIAINGGKAMFENGFFNNRGNDILRIVPDWHRVKGWNTGYKMTALDHEDVKSLQETYRNTLADSKKLADFILKENRIDLLTIPASIAFNEFKQISNEQKILPDKYKI